MTTPNSATDSGEILSYLDIEVMFQPVYVYIKYLYYFMDRVNQESRTGT